MLLIACILRYSIVSSCCTAHLLWSWPGGHQLIDSLPDRAEDALVVCGWAVGPVHRRDFSSGHSTQVGAQLPHHEHMDARQNLCMIRLAKVVVGCNEAELAQADEGRHEASCLQAVMPQCWVPRKQLSHNSGLRPAGHWHACSAAWHQRFTSLQVPPQVMPAIASPWCA